VLVYAVLAHWAFGGGWLQSNGALDFAGGIPVEMASGFAALAAALVVGARKDYGRQALLPHNTVFVLLGAGLLWFGGFGFNGGSGLSTGDASVLAFVNTLLCPACALVTWAVLDLIRDRQVTAVGAATASSGRVGITPPGPHQQVGDGPRRARRAAQLGPSRVHAHPRGRDARRSHGIGGLVGICLSASSHGSWGVATASVRQPRQSIAVAALYAPLRVRRDRCTASGSSAR
jgi:Amt family ammonium transporter